MTRIEAQSVERQHRRVTACVLPSLLATGTVLNAPGTSAGANLLQNPGFEAPRGNTETPPHWSTTAGGQPRVTDQIFRGGGQALGIPVRSLLVQRVESVKAGACLARARVKSEAQQTISLLVQEANQPWAGYACAEIRVPGNEWVQVETFCSLEKVSGLTCTLGELEKMGADAQSRSRAIYATSLPSVQEKTENIKKLLVEGTNDGFVFGNLDCWSTAGSQDDLCCHYNRFVLQLVQTAVLNCGDSPEKAAIARHLWDQSRLILRQPTRRESRRTLHFFEP